MGVGVVFEATASGSVNFPRASFADESSRFAFSALLAGTENQIEARVAVLQKVAATRAVFNAAARRSCGTTHRALERVSQRDVHHVAAAKRTARPGSEGREPSITEIPIAVFRCHRYAWSEFAEIASPGHPVPKFA